MNNFGRVLPDNFDAVLTEEGILVYPKDFVWQDLIEASGVAGNDYPFSNEEIIKVMESGIINIKSKRFWKLITIQ